MKNRICTPIAPPTVPLDWLRMLQTELANRACWTEFPEIDAWLATARLDPFTKNLTRLFGVDAEATAHLSATWRNAAGATTNIGELLADAQG